MQPVAVRKPTSHDVARLAGVSQATVSRVLQNSPLVQPGTREVVLDAIARTGYAPNAAARWMRTQRTNIIALVVANLAVNPLYPAILQLLFTALRQRGLSASVYEQEDFSEDTMRVMVEGGVDGVIMTTAMESSQPFLERIAEKVPLILLHRTVSSDAFDQFSSDNLASGAAVAGYFLDGGRKRMGLISGFDLPSTLRERERGFLDALARQGAGIDERDIARVPRFSYAAGVDAAQQILRSGKVDAIFGVNDTVAIGALDGIRRCGLSVPEDVWVVGHDDVPMAAWDSINLSTVAQSRDAMVEAAVERLSARLEDRTLTPARVVLPHTFIRRGTAG